MFSQGDSMGGGTHAGRQYGKGPNLKRHFQMRGLVAVLSGNDYKCCSRLLIKGINEPRHRLSLNDMKRVQVYSFYRVAILTPTNDRL